MTLRILRLFCFSLAWLVPGYAEAQGYPGYPYTIMTPEHGTAHRGPRAARGKAMPRLRASSPQHLGRRVVIARGSSGIVLPTPLPRTQLIPPEGGTAPVISSGPQHQGPTFVPGLNPVPNLPHGAESFQDRASRCAFQQGLYGVRGNMTTQYIGACLQ